MRSSPLPIVAAIILALAGAVSSAAAAGTVQLELVGDARGAALDFQHWLRVLAAAGVRNVRIRGAKPTDKVGIENRGTGDSPIYVVTGVVQSRTELLLPIGRIRQTDAARLARWLDELAKYGPEGPGQQQAAFGLTPEQFEQVRDQMAQGVRFSTKGMPRDEAVQQIGRRLGLPLRLDSAAAGALRRDKVAEELLGLSGGTVLAYVLRPAGYCLVPRTSGQQTVYSVTRAAPKLEVWPVGWEPDGPRKEVLPAMFEFHNVNVQGVSAAVALEAIGRRLKVPVLIDHNSLARHGIQPEKAMVSHPGRRTTYSLALRRMLFQAGLKAEVRVDEAGKPFLWITTVKPV